MHINFFLVNLLAFFEGYYGILINKLDTPQATPHNLMLLCYWKYLGVLETARLIIHSCIGHLRIHDDANEINIYQ